MKKILITLLITLSGLNLFAQGKLLNSPKNYFGYRPLYKDTMYVDFGNGQKMELVYRWFDLFREDEAAYKKYFWDEFDTMFTIIQEKMEELPLKEDAKYHIKLISKSNYNPMRYGNVKYKRGGKVIKIIPDSAMQAHIDSFFNGNISVTRTLLLTERDITTKQSEYLLSDKKLIAKAQSQHIIEFGTNGWTTRFFLNDLRDMSSFTEVDLNGFFRELKERFLENQYYKYHMKLNYKVDDGKLEYVYARDQFRRKRSKYIALKFSPMAGTSLVNGKFSADLGATLGLSFNDQQTACNRIGLRYQLKGIGLEQGADGNRMSYNGFLDATWDINIEEDYKRPEWVGAGIGYLIHQEAQVYGNKTARIFLKYRSTNMWGVQPEFNYSFEDNKSFIGLGFFFSL